MGSLAAVGVDYYLAACQAGVAVRSANHELAGGVDKELEVGIEQAALRLGQQGLDALDEDVAHVLADAGEHGLVGVELVVLGGDDDGVNADGTVVVIIFDRHLALGVGAQIGHLPALAADGGQLDEQLVGQVDGQRHIVFGVAAGVSEHHALVAGALVVGVLALYAAVDVGRLLVDGREDAARAGVEHVFGLSVADAANHIARHVLHRHEAFGLDLAGHDCKPCGDKCLACYFGVRILTQEVVEDGV